MTNPPLKPVTGFQRGIRQPRLSNAKLLESFINRECRLCSNRDRSLSVVGGILYYKENILAQWVGLESAVLVLNRTVLVGMQGRHLQNLYQLACDKGITSVSAHNVPDGEFLLDKYVSGMGRVIMYAKVGAV